MVILPNVTPSASDVVIARITYFQTACYGFTVATTQTPPGTFEIGFSSVAATGPVSCTQVFDVALGALPNGIYIVNFRTFGGAFATATFQVGGAAATVNAIPTLSTVGLIVLAALMWLVMNQGRKTGAKLMAWLVGVGAVLALGQPILSRAETARTETELTRVGVTLNREVERRPISEIVSLLNSRSSDPIVAGLRSPVAARRLMIREPTTYELEVIAKHPNSLLAKLFNHLVLSYPSTTSPENMRELLLANPMVRHVEIPIQIASSAVDPMLGAPGGPASTSQWGLHELSFPSAWAKTKGRAIVAYIDRGIDTAQGDLSSALRVHLSRNMTLHGNGDLTSTNLSDEAFLNSADLVSYHGHGTHVAGIIAATNFNGLGGSGGCPGCSLVAIKMSYLDTLDLPVALDYAVSVGAQVLNISSTLFDSPCNSPSTDSRAWCQAMGRVIEAGITVVASAGNFGGGNPQAPASGFGVIAASGLQQGVSSGLAEFWKGLFVEPGNYRFGSDYIAKGDWTLLAPAVEILSTFPLGAVYGTFTSPSNWSCGDSIGGSLTDGFGVCTGTSMSAPFISAMAGLVRSVKPTLGIFETQDLLASTAPREITFNTMIGNQAGAANVTAKIPNANSALQGILGDAPNNLVTLFSFYSPYRGGHFYTTSPQSAKAAIAGTLIPKPVLPAPLPGVSEGYLPVGNPGVGYNCFPADMDDLVPISCTAALQPRAAINVYSTENSPFGGALLPLYRLSSFNGTNVVRHIYETDSVRRAHLETLGFKLDSIEGYVLPAYVSGSVKLCRRYHPGLNDFVLFAGAGPSGSDCTSTEGECDASPNNCGPKGYTNIEAVDNIGWVIPALDGNDDDGDGVPAYVEWNEGLNTALKDNNIFGATTSGRRLFAMQQYRDFLVREGDTGGITYWTSYLNTNSQAALVESFFNSPEFQSTGAPIVRLYFAYFLRIPDTAGLKYQVDQARMGVPLSAISQNFAISLEFTTTYGALDNAAFVVKLYQNVLDRAASQGEIDYHVARLVAGASRGDLMIGFSESPEFKASSDTKIFIVMTYFGLLRRAPEQAGFDYYKAPLDAGSLLRSTMIQNFLNSPEYHNRFVP